LRWKKILEDVSRAASLTPSEAGDLIDDAMQTLLSEKSFLELSCRRAMFVGDLHGDFLSTIWVIRFLQKEKPDLVVFLGDYIDRGPSSREVVDLIRALSKAHVVTPIKGNHEDMMLKCVEEGDCATWYFNGADATIRSFGGIDEMRKRMDDLYWLSGYQVLLPGVCFPVGKLWMF